MMVNLSNYFPSIIGSKLIAMGRILDMMWVNLSPYAIHLQGNYTITLHNTIVAEANDTLVETGNVDLPWSRPETLFDHKIKAFLDVAQKYVLLSISADINWGLELVFSNGLRIRFDPPTDYEIDCEFWRIFVKGRPDLPHFVVNSGKAAWE